MESTTQPDRGDVREAAASAVAADPATAALLAKHAAFKEGMGPKPTQSEFGRLGAWIKKTFTPTPGAVTPGNVPPAAVATAQASDDLLDTTPVDAGLVQRTTSAVLSRCESIARRYVGNAARKAGAAGETLARLDRAASIPKDDRALMVELSPDVAAALGMNPRHYPVAVFCGCMGLWATDLFLAVQELKAMEAERNLKPATTGASLGGRLSDPGASLSLGDRTIADPPLPAGLPKPIMGGK